MKEQLTQLSDNHLSQNASLKGKDIDSADWIDLLRLDENIATDSFIREIDFSLVNYENSVELHTNSKKESKQQQTSEPLAELDTIVTENNDGESLLTRLILFLKNAISYLRRTRNHIKIRDSYLQKSVGWDMEAFIKKHEKIMRNAPLMEYDFQTKIDLMCSKTPQYVINCKSGCKIGASSIGTSNQSSLSLYRDAVEELIVEKLGSTVKEDDVFACYQLYCTNHAVI